MKPRGRIISAIVAVAIALVATLVLMVVLSLRPPTIKPIGSLEFSQSQTLQDWPTTVHRVTAPAQVDRFRDLLIEYGVDPAGYRAGHFDPLFDDRCTGGLTTDVTIEYQNLSSQKLAIYSCGGGEEADTFKARATALFTGWRQQGAD